MSLLSHIQFVQSPLFFQRKSFSQYPAPSLCFLMDFHFSTLDILQLHYPQNSPSSTGKFLNTLPILSPQSLNTTSSANIRFLAFVELGDIRSRSFPRICTPHQLENFHVVCNQQDIQQVLEDQPVREGRLDRRP